MINIIKQNINDNMEFFYFKASFLLLNNYNFNVNLIYDLQYCQFFRNFDKLFY